MCKIRYNIFMQYIDEIEHPPIPTTIKCKSLILIVEFLLRFSTFLSAILLWYIYDYFIALSSLLLSFIVVGIIRSKLRNESIPFSQRERDYNDKEIAQWYVMKYLCLDLE